ncbi:hypothetical protein Dimus_020216 [Dionaea muscipula]
MNGSPSLKIQDSKPGGARGMFEKHQKPKSLRGSQLEETSRVFVKNSRNAVRGEMVVLPSCLVGGVQGLGPTSVKSRLALEERKPYSGKRRTLKAWRWKEVSAKVPVAEELNAYVRRRHTYETGIVCAGRRARVYVMLGKKSQQLCGSMSFHGQTGVTFGKDCGNI